MRIAEITYSMRQGGAEAFVKQLSCEFSLRGHDVTVILLDRVGDTPIEREALNTLRAAGVKVVPIGRRGRAVASIAALMRLRACLAEGDFDVVHSHGGLIDLMVVLCKKLASIRSKLVFTIHSSNYETRGVVPEVIRFCRNTGAVVFCSEAAMRRNKEEGFQSARVIENGVALGAPAGKVHPHVNDDGGTNCNRRNKEIKLLAVGRISEPKNHEAMLGGVKWLLDHSDHDVVLEIAGGGDPSSLRAVAAELGIESQVLFLGVRTDIPELLAEADIFISTSLWEGLPLAVLEAFNSGISCVLSPIQEHLDIGENVESCYFPSDLSPQAVGEAVIEAHRRLSSKARVRARRQAVMDRYSIQRCADEYIALFQELIQRG